MHKLFSNLAPIVFVLMVLCSCGSGGGDGNQSPSTTGSTDDTSNIKYLARNIILNASLVKSAYADESRVLDTETQILAENVIVETDDESQIESDNVQDALKEISLELSAVMVGTWNIQNHNQEIYHDPTGQMVIYDDGTFDLVEGSFAAIGMGSGTAQDGFCNHTEENQTYQLYTEDLVLFIHFNDTTENTAIPRLVKLRENEMIFIGSGGCGYSGRQRISVLTRVAE